MEAEILGQAGVLDGRLVVAPEKTVVLRVGTVPGGERQVVEAVWPGRGGRRQACSWGKARVVEVTVSKWARPVAPVGRDRDCVATLWAHRSTDIRQHCRAP